MLPVFFVCAALGVSTVADAAPVPEPVSVVVAAPAPGAVGTAGAADAPATCAVRDPEDGRCYPSADAADLVWLARDGAAPRAPKAPSAAVLTVADDEELSDDEDAEDGGALAPVDGALAPGKKLAAFSDLQKAARPSVLSGLFARVKGLVVRRSDSKPVSVPEDKLEALFDADFPLPIEAFNREKFRDSFLAKRGRHRKHHAIDLPAPRGTPVVAVVDGTIERLGRDRKGGLVVYLRDLSGRFTFYFAHLRRHETGLRVGDRVVRGQRLGEVGTTGHVIGGPHLHFAIFREAEDESNWKALAVNPYVVFSTFFRK